MATVTTTVRTSVTCIAHYILYSAVIDDHIMYYTDLQKIWHLIAAVFCRNFAVCQ
jgi:hypothetical protein